MLSLLSTALATLATASSSFSVQEIQPPHWWAGMNDTTLMLQVYGRDIRSAVPQLSYPGVTLDSVVRLDGSPNWQYLYLTVSPQATPGSMEIIWTHGKKKVKRKYELKARENHGGAKGFSAADVLYLVMPDRFADGNPGNNTVSSLRNNPPADRNNLNIRHGGDIAGIEAHADYLDSLGITALWLNPVLENDMPGGSYHGYATTDYYRVDPRLGTNDDYARLVKTLHKKGIKTVMDMIFNHCGSAHPWFEERPASDWFNFPEKYVQTNYRLSTISDPYASDYDRKLTTDGWFVADMPDLNQRQPQLMRYLIQNSIWWIEEVGIDGIRMDTYPYADKAEMGNWIDAVKSEYPDFQIVGECWFGDPSGEAYWQTKSYLDSGDDSRLPVVMDFPLSIKSADIKPFREDTDPWHGLNTIYDHLALDFIYPDINGVLRFLDNHDTDRFIHTLPSDLGSWKQAVATLLTIPGIPQIYYGTELLMHGTRANGGDGAIRLDMPGGFPGDTASGFTREGRTPLQNEAFDFMSKLLKWRKSNPELWTAPMKHFMPTNGLYVMQRRTDDGKEMILILNGTDKHIEADMSRYSEIISPGTEYTEVISGDRVIPVTEDNSPLSLAPRATLILSRQ